MSFFSDLLSLNFYTLASKSRTHPKVTITSSGALHIEPIEVASSTQASTQVESLRELKRAGVMFVSGNHPSSSDD